MHKLISEQELESINKIAEELNRPPLIIDRKRSLEDELYLHEDDSDYFFIYAVQWDNGYTVYRARDVGRVGYLDEPEQVNDELFYSDSLVAAYRKFAEAITENEQEKIS